MSLRWLTVAGVVAASMTAAAASGAVPTARSEPSTASSGLRDRDRDGLSDDAERRQHTNPRKRDTDGDSLSDGREVNRYRTNPRKRDTDGDGFGDGVEVRAGTNPRSARSHFAFPSEANTGVPPDMTLSRYTGPSTVSRANTVIVGKTMGCIRVMAQGVVIRKSKISCGGPIAVRSDDGDFAGTPLLIEDSEIDCKNTPGSHGIAEANLVARRVEISACENGFDLNQHVLIEDSYIHDLYNGGEAHMDGIQFASRLVDGKFVKGVLDVTIRHNTIYGIGPDGSFGTSAIITNTGGDTDVLIENNLLAGGAYALYCEQGVKGTDYVVRDNHFSTRFGPKVGHYGPSTDCDDEIQSGNVHHETGRRLRLE
jgi:hypothetical protein